jgi:hypothetical protein
MRRGGGGVVVNEPFEVSLRGIRVPVDSGIMSMSWHASHVNQQITHNTHQIFNATKSRATC